MAVGRVLVIFLVVLLSAPAVAAAEKAKWTRTDFDFTSFDGTILKASKWVPADGCPCPAVMETNGWNNRHDMGEELRYAEHFADGGYYVLGFTSRGWGNSGGEIELDGPKEQNDTRALVDFLTEQPEVLQDGPGDPRVGMVGQSYAGGIQLLSAQGDARIDSIIPHITWNNLLGSLAPQDVFKVGWVSELYATGQTVGRGVPASGKPGDPNLSGPSQKLTEWYAAALAINGPTPEMRSDIGHARSLHPGRLATPTLLVQGWGDTLFQPNEALTTYNDLLSRGVPARLIYYPGGHGQSLPSTEPASIFVDQQMDDWYNVTLRHLAPTLPQYPVTRYRFTEKDYVGETQWPPAGTEYWLGFLGAKGLGPDPPATAATVQIVNPVGPATCADAPNFQSQTGAFCPYTTPSTSTIMAGPPLDADREVTGTPVAHLVVSSTQSADVRLFLTLVDVDASGKGLPILKQAVPIRLATGAETEVDVSMQSITATLAKGHSIGLQVATTDAGFFSSREAGAVTLSSSKEKPSWLAVPFVPKDKWGDHTPPSVTVKATPFVEQGLEGETRLSYRLDIMVRDVTGLPQGFLDADPLPFDMMPNRTSTRAEASMVVGWQVLPADVHLTAVDLLGNQADINWSPPSDYAATGCAAGEMRLCPQPTTPQKRTPGFEVVFLLAAFAVVLALRRV
ncbi:MAG TPA: CocE/NonD family hydrolase [Candidatus Thermoplasmatota archaeon]|nr:CocE/NonD family hydrolase [Candidatus Thermoplasmatota archaeon]